MMIQRRSSFVGPARKRRVITHNSRKLLSTALGPAMVMVAWDQVAQAQTYEFNYTAGFQTWMVPATGVYTITTYGGQGGDALFGQYYSTPWSDGFGGRGAKIGGDFNLVAGQALTIGVGGQGGSSFYGGGGGGSSFVVGSGVRLFAGGGGGGGYYSQASGGVVGPNGYSGGGSAYSSGSVYYPGSGGTAGLGGGGGSSPTAGGGGGGFYSNGGNASGGSGGDSYLSGFAGGIGLSYFSAAYGGFGGGGGGYGGGGGGFSGGGGGGFYDGGGGGGSYNNGFNQTGVAGYQAGDGLVQITLVPEPTALGLATLGLAAGAIGFVSRRRSSGNSAATPGVWVSRKG